jgi:hypothetical protein
MPETYTAGEHVLLPQRHSIDGQGLIMRQSFNVKPDELHGWTGHNIVDIHNPTGLLLYEIRNCSELIVD